MIADASVDERRQSYLLRKNAEKEFKSLRKDRKMSVQHSKSHRQRKYQAELGRSGSLSCRLLDAAELDASVRVRFRCQPTDFSSVQQPFDLWEEAVARAERNFTLWAREAEPREVRSLWTQEAEPREVRSFRNLPSICAHFSSDNVFDAKIAKFLRKHGKSLIKKTLPSCVWRTRVCPSGLDHLSWRERLCARLESLQLASGKGT